MFTVVITEKEGPERRITFTEAEVTVGRVPGNDVVLPKGNVSKRHSRIVFKDNRFIVVDLKSTNGTYVNGRKITSPLVVKEGDKIYVGDYILTLEGAPALDALRPPSLLPTLGDGPSPLVRSLAEPLPASAEHPAQSNGSYSHRGDDGVPAILRGGRTSSVPPPPGGAASSEMPVSAADPLDEDDAILPAESELEVFEDHIPPSIGRDTRGDAPAQVFPPPIEARRQDRGGRAVPLRPTQENLTRDTLLGPIDFVLADSDVFHVVVERYDRIRADRGQGLVLERTSFASPEALVRVAQEVSAQAGIAAFTPSYDISLPDGRHVVAVQAGAASNGPVLSVRRRPTRVTPLVDLVTSELVPSALAGKLEDALRQKRHVWFAGPSGVDLSSIAASAVATCPDSERIALFERAPELALGERSSVCIKLGAVPIGELLERVRFFRPDRLVLSGLAEAELAPVLDAFAHRHDGSIATFEARSAKDALAQLDRAAGADLTLRAVSLLVELKRGEDGKTRATAAYDIELDASGELALKQH
jgi:pilus assembly protein CpaF